MAEIVIPRGNEGLLALLDTAARVVADDAQAGIEYAEPGWLDEVEAFLPDFRAKVRGLTRAQQRRAQCVAERRALIDDLSAYNRDFLVGFKRRVKRERLSTSCYEFFDLPLDGKLPKVNAIDEITSWAAILVQGDADMVAAGFEPMCNPTAAQVKALLDKVNLTNVPAAERDLDAAQDEVEALRARAIKLARDLAASLKYRLRKLDPSDRQRIVRRYGFKLRFPRRKPVDAG